jgi:hypothetical protein
VQTSLHTFVSTTPELTLRAVDRKKNAGKMQEKNAGKKIQKQKKPAV